MNDFDRRRSGASVAEAAGELERGRVHFARRAWADAHGALARADRAVPLGRADLERLADSAYLIGREDDYLAALERAHRACLDADEPVRAARCAFWIGLCLAFRGDGGPATGWFGRARRLLDRAGRDCAERGYLLLPAAEQQLVAAAGAAAHATATQAAEIGERFEDADLIACARHLQGRALLQQGQVEAGLSLLDEAMVAVAAGELSPVMTGLVYCSVIDACQQVYALDRARDWTEALARWCADQAQLVSFTGTCLVHRAEIMAMHGAWSDAIAEARRACAGSPGEPPAEAFYQEGEVHRLRGAVQAAEKAYRNASERGFEPQPGLALLRLAEGRIDAAAAAIRRAAAATGDALDRTRLLPACVEIMLAAGEVAEARRACGELEEIAAAHDIGVLRAMAAQAAGSVALAEGDAAAALRTLGDAVEAWREVEAPYPAARTRELIGRACRAMGDDEGAALELAAAAAAFERLGAVPDRDRVAALVEGGAPARRGGLTPRELEVLRLVAAGKTNKAIAAELGLSGKTIDRHVSNIFDKLDVHSRAAATAYAYEHKLI